MDKNLDSQVIYECEGCSHNVYGSCLKWVSPLARFHINRCSSCGLATHIALESRLNAERIRAGQQKSKKFKRKSST